MGWQGICLLPLLAQNLVYSLEVAMTQHQIAYSVTQSNLFLYMYVWYY